jgi:quercetin dioxygenase-like cupin family protein
MEIEYENEKIIYNPGDGIFIPDGSEHKHKGKVLSKKALVFFIEKV